MYYDRSKPFLAPLKDIYRLNKPGSTKETYHVVLDVNGSGIVFNVGDSIAILPSHDLELVQRTLDALHASGDEIIRDKRSLEERSFHEHLRSRANITKLHKSLLEAIEAKERNLVKKIHLQELIEPKNHDKFLAYAATHEVWDCLLDHPEVLFSVQEIADLLPPLLPRFYSIASSLAAAPNEVHLTVAMSDFESNGKKRYGVGTHFLCRLVKEHNLQVPLYIHPSNGFTLPENKHASIIMVGPGTGIAPFRAFMQQRIFDQTLGKNWLFFGECTRKHDYFYEEFWQDLHAKGMLRLDLAFSRDAAHKTYVQHKMLEQKMELWQWLEEGAHFYVCGDLHHMAKDVDVALHAIVQECGLLSDLETKAYIKNLKREKRYLRDVY
ncbi:MAG: hypothetical protein P4L16_01515 [Chlamydiales bacterium]|nr:hypothetical protein [Chlamydiales bacterium]